VIGLTGGVGMGKSTAHQLLLKRDIPVVDTDVLARDVVEPGQPALEEVRQLFGQSIVGPDGRLVRQALADLVFADPDARKKLEAILHPRIQALWQEQVETWRKEGKLLAFVVIPLLFETKAEEKLDATICAACSAPTQRQRLTERGWSPEEIKNRIAAQLPVETKMLKSNYVIWTEGDLNVHAEQLDRILRKMG